MTRTVWIHYARPRTRWYRLDPADRLEHLRHWLEVDQESAAVGGRRQGSFHIRGQSDFATVEIWTFPDVDAAFAHWAAKVDAGYANWFAFANNVGAEVTDGPT